MSDRFTIRRYEPGDPVQDLHERGLRAAGAYDEAFAHRDADLRDVEGAYLDSGGEFLVGVLGGDPVAMGAFRPAGEGTPAPVRSGVATVELKRMRVAPAHHRRGFGSAILAELERRARDAGFEEAVLDTGTDQTAARAFYESHGYEQCGREDVGPTTLVYYRRELRDCGGQTPVE